MNIESEKFASFEYSIESNDSLLFIRRYFTGGKIVLAGFIDSIVDFKLLNTHPLVYLLYKLTILTYFLNSEIYCSIFKLVSFYLYFRSNKIFSTMGIVIYRTCFFKVCTNIH